MSSTVYQLYQDLFYSIRNRGIFKILVFEINSNKWENYD